MFIKPQIVPEIFKSPGKLGSNHQPLWTFSVIKMGFITSVCFKAVSSFLLPFNCGGILASTSVQRNKTNLLEHSEGLQRQHSGTVLHLCCINAVSKFYNLNMPHQETTLLKLSISMDYKLNIIYYRDYTVHESEKYPCVEEDFLQG